MCPRAHTFFGIVTRLAWNEVSALLNPGPTDRGMNNFSQRFASPTATRRRVITSSRKAPSGTRDTKHEWGPAGSCNGTLLYLYNVHGPRNCVREGARWQTAIISHRSYQRSNCMFYCALRTLVMFIQSKLKKFRCNLDGKSQVLLVSTEKCLSQSL
jgi:hypothetical protein